jgi:hypothetical protein
MAVAKKVSQEKTNVTGKKSAASKPSRKKNLSRKEKLEVIRKANQLLENVWDKIYDSHQTTDAKINF